MQRTGENLLCLTLKDSNGTVICDNELPCPEERLGHINKMISIGLLTASIGHEIINPNNYISLSASMLAEIWEDLRPALARTHAEHGAAAFGRFPFPELETLVPKMIQGIHDGSDKVVSIANKIKEFAAERNRAGSEIDVNAAVQQAFSLLQSYAYKYTNDFHLSLQEELPFVPGNQSSLKQLLINLIMNALQSISDKRGEVSVTTFLDQEEGSVVVTVRDEGNGISADLLSRITEPFFSTREMANGPGLGLFTAAALAREHDWRLEFRSSPGTGTTATVRLPYLAPTTRPRISNEEQRQRP